jgi:DNA-binding CsgD family transcriptional regulator/tetratricopeptide (TPR) repeat protein
LRGRQAEIDRIAGAVKASGDGSGGVVLFDGPAGIGKTALLGEARRLGAEAGFVVCSGDCDELDQVTPLAPLLVGLRSSSPALVSGAQEHNILTTTEPLWATERLGEILETASARQPVMVVVDDVQWADRATLLALSTLPVRLFSVPVLWVLARRPVPTSPPLDTLTARVVRAGGTTIKLGPLDPDAAARLAADLLDATPDRSLRSLVGRAGGNPFYLVELVSDLRDRGAITLRNGVAELAEARVPERVGAWASMHARVLRGETQRMLEVASVLGRQFSPADLAAVIGQPVGRLLGALEEATRSEILVDSGETLSFRHDLLRQAIYDALPSTVRDALHREVVTALQARDASAAAVAAHVAAGARPGDERAIALLEEAAIELRGPNPGAAVDLARRAAELRDVDDPRRQQSIALAIELLSYTGHADDAIALSDRLRREGPVDPAIEVALLADLRLSYLVNGEIPTHLPPVPAELLDDPAVPRCAALRLQLWDKGFRFGEDLDGADQATRDVMAEAERIGADDITVMCLMTRQLIAWAQGDLTRTVEEMQRAVAIADAGDPTVKRSNPRTQLGYAIYGVDRVEEGLAILGRAVVDAQRYGRSTLPIVETIRSLMLLSLGRLEDAANEALSAISDAEDAGRLRAPHGAYAALLLVALRRGDLRAARAVAEDLTPGRVGGGHQHPIYPWALAMLAEAEGRRPEALDILAPSIEALAQGRFLFGVPDFEHLPQLAALALRAGRPDAAQQVAAATTTLARRNPEVTGLAGIAAHAVGIARGSEEHLREAVSVLGPGTRPLAAAAAFEDLAELLEQTGRYKEAIDLLEDADRTYATCGASRDEARVRGALRRFGVHHRRVATEPAARGWDSLSPAELAVARVIAEGVTSQVAAERLFLSVNTVNTHLRHVFNKLGIRSRVELARLVVSSGH